MKIAILGILGQGISKNAKGGTELFTYNLAEGLNKRGHEVTLYSANIDDVSIRIKSIFNQEDIDAVSGSEKEITRSFGVMHSVLFANFIKDQQQYDLVHISCAEWYYFLPLIPFLKIPHIITVHSKLLPDPVLEKIFELYPDTTLAFVSKRQQELFPSLKKSFVIYNGIELGQFSENTDNYIAWLGRFNEYKGAKEAIELALKANRKIIIGGSGEDSSYFQQSIKPLIDSQSDVEFLGLLDQKKKNQLLSKAKLFLNPIKWEEPFGLVMAEAMACGTPVLSYDLGAAKEIIDDKTGYLCVSGDENCMVEKINQIYSLEPDKYVHLRRQCRKRVEEEFTLEKMLNQYELIYREIISGN